LIVRCASAYSTISLAIYGTILSNDVPRNYPFAQTPYAVAQLPSVEDMLSGAAWKDTTSSSVGGTGPYVPKMLLGRFDSEAERQTRRNFYMEKRRDENMRNYATAVQLLREEGIISGHVAYELESKLQDEDGTTRSLTQ